jgi:hypothetical protein
MRERMKEQERIERENKKEAERQEKLQQKELKRVSFYLLASNLLCNR